MIQIILLDNGVRVANIDYPNNHLVFGIERTNIIEIFDSGKKVVSAPYTEFINELGQPFLTPESVITTLELSYLNLVSQEELDVEIADRVAADTALSNRTTILENNEYKILYFETISASTGTITKPTNSTIILDQFYSGGDAIVETLVNGQPSGQSPLTSSGSVVSVSSFDVNGNYTLSSTPSSFDVALLYILKIKAIDYGNIVKANELNREEEGVVKINSPTFTGTVTTPAIIVSSETASRVAIIDASKNVKSADTTTYPSLTELSYGKGVTSAIQTQLDNKGNSQPIYSGKWRTIPFASLPAASVGYHNTVWYVPYIVSSTHTITDIGIEVTTGAVASNVRLALYSDNNGVPSTLIEESGAINSVGTGLKTYTFSSPIVLSASSQVYWMALQASLTGIALRQGNSSICNLYINGTGSFGPMYYQTQAFGSFPASATPVGVASQVALLISLKAQ